MGAAAPRPGRPRGLLALTLSLALLATFHPAASAEAAAVDAGGKKKGRLLEVSLNGAIRARQAGSIRGDEFGSDIGADVLPASFGPGGCLVGGPAARDSVGRVAAYDCTSDRSILGRLLFAIDGDQLAGGPVARFGQSVMNIGHVDGDRAVHWAIGAPGTGAADSPPAAVVILHEREGELAERLRLEGDPESRFGWQLAPLEIADGTSFHASFAVGAPGRRLAARPAAGAVQRFDSRTGELLWARSGTKRGQYLGYALSTVVDRDGDGVPDLVAGGPGRVNGKTGGVVLVISGANGRVLDELEAPRGATLFGFAVAVAQVDADGIVDVLVGAPLADSDGLEDNGAVFAYSGADGSLLGRWNGLVDGEWLGVSVRGVVDSDGGPLLGIAASSLMLNEANPRRDRRGALTIFSTASTEVLGRRLGKRRGERLGWPILGCVDDCLIGQPRAPEFFTPE